MTAEYTLLSLDQVLVWLKCVIHHTLTLDCCDAVDKSTPDVSGIETVDTSCVATIGSLGVAIVNTSGLSTVGSSGACSNSRWLDVWCFAASSCPHMVRWLVYDTRHDILYNSISLVTIHVTEFMHGMQQLDLN